MACVVCNCANPRYKCPGCVARYCSVACFGQHKPACVPRSSQPSGSSTGQTAALIRAASKRPYEGDREEVSFKVSEELLKRVSCLAPSRAVLDVLRARAKADGDAKKAKVSEAEPEDDDRPEELSTKLSHADPVAPAPPMSAATADQVARTNRMADIVVKVCSAPTLAQKRDLILNFCASDSECDAFCNILLEEMGARKEGASGVVSDFWFFF